MSAKDDDSMRLRSGSFGSSLDVDLHSLASATFASDDIHTFKLLIPCAMAGKFIGKNGCEIVAIGESSGARLKLSKADELFRDTYCRTLSMFGSIQSLLFAINEITRKLGTVTIVSSVFDKDTDQKLLYHSVVCLVTHAMAGTIIGHSGGNVKNVNEATGCKIKIATVSDPANALERTMTIVGPSWESISLAFKMIFDLLLDQSIGFKYNSKKSASSSQSIGSESSSSVRSNVIPFSENNSNLQLAYCPSAVLSGKEPTLQTGLRLAYCPRTVLDGKDPPPHGLCPLTVHKNSIFALNSPNGLQPPQAHGPFAVLDESFAKYMTPPVFNNASLSEGGTLVMSLGVDERFIGSVLGKQGTVIRELMQITKTSVQVSNRGVYMPGTTCREIKVFGALDRLKVVHALILDCVGKAIQSQIVHSESKEGSQEDASPAAAAAANTQSSLFSFLPNLPSRLSHYTYGSL